QGEMVSVELHSFAPCATTQALDASGNARLRRMVEQHFNSVWRAVKRLGVDDSNVDDATQKVFMVAASKLETIAPPGERAHLLGMALGSAADARRSASRRPDVADGGLAADVATDHAPLADALVDEKRARAILSAALDRLTPELRDAFVLFELEELTA